MSKDSEAAHARHSPADRFAKGHFLTTTTTATATATTATATTRNQNRPPTGRSSITADPSVRALGIGIDTARFGHHVSFLRDDKQPAAAALPITESRAGYHQLQARLEQLHQRFPLARLHLRIDAAGQYAANWEAFVRSLTHLPLTISVGEPKRNKDYHHAHSPKRQTDASESYAMARYAVVERPSESFGKPPEFAALRRVAGRLHAQTKQTTRLTNQLHETLSGGFPELATLVSNITTGWVLTLLEKYPTAQRIAAARLSSLEAIPFLAADKARQIQEAAQQSIGTFRSAVAEELIRAMVGELRHSLAEEARWNKLLIATFDGLPAGAHRQIATIQGIGPQTAAAIVATAVDINRFETDNHFVGYYGVFPHEMQSGVDKFGRPIPAGKKSMCHKGNDLVRGLLWNCAKCAAGETGGNPAVRALYLRRLAAGDTPQVAWGYCMTKLLRQVFGVWTSGQPFDPRHEPRPQKSEPQKSEPTQSAGTPTEGRTPTDDVTPTAETKAEAAGLRDESQPPRGLDEEVTEASASTLEPVSTRDDQPAAHVVPEVTTLAAGEPLASCDIHSATRPNPSQVSSTPRALDAAGRSSRTRRPIDYAALRERVSFTQILEHLGQHADGAQHRGPCPLHERHGEPGRSFSVNLKRNLFRCFDSTCGAQGNVLDFWSAHRNLPRYDAAVDLAATFQIPLPLLPSSNDKPPRKTHKKNRASPRQALDFNRYI